MFDEIFINKHHKFILYNFENNDDCINWANETAIKKVTNTIDTWQRRSKIQRYTDIMLGDLAKNIVKKYLLVSNPDLQDELIEYDTIRTDNFKNRDVFDLKIKNHAIEVKSSAEKYEKDLNKIFNNRRIIVNVGNIHEHDTEFLIQVFFIPKNLNFFKNIESINHNQNLKNFSEIFCKDLINETKPYICGWANKEMQIKAKNDLFTVKNNYTNANKRNYANILLCKSMSIEQLLISIKNIL